MLEIGGTAFTVVMDYVKALREFALESTHGNRTDPQKMATAQSGRAMEILNQSLIQLADKLRVSYGEGALLSLLKMVIAAHAKLPLTIEGRKMMAIKPDIKVTLRWPAWYHATAADLQAQAQTLSTLTESGLMSKETGVSALAANYDVADTNAEITKIEARRDERARGSKLTLVPPSQ